VTRQGKLNMLIIFESVLMLFTQSYQTKSVHAWRNYSFSKL